MNEPDWPNCRTRAWQPFASFAFCAVLSANTDHDFHSAKGWLVAASSCVGNVWRLCCAGYAVWYRPQSRYRNRRRQADLAPLHRARLGASRPAATAWMVWYVPQASHLAWYEKIIVFFNVGLANGAVGIVYAHELMHQKNKQERWADDILMALVGYGHFRRNICWFITAMSGRPAMGSRRAITSISTSSSCAFCSMAFQVPGALKNRCGRKNLPVWHSSNPHWRYWGLQIGMMIVAVTLGGFVGLLLA